MDTEPDDADEDVPVAPPGWLSVEEFAEKLFLDLLSGETARVFIERLASKDLTQDAVMTALVALIFQVQDQVDDPSKDLISFILSGIDPVATAFAEGDGTYPVAPEIELRRYVGESNRFMVGAPRSWLEPIGLSINERLERAAGSADADTE